MNKTIVIRKVVEKRIWAGHYLRIQAQELLQATDSPFGLAVAFALGTLTSFLPVPLLDSLLAAGLAVKFARLNKAAIFLARMVWNDLLVVPLYVPGLKVGQWILTAVLVKQESQVTFQPHYAYLLSFILGAMVLAAVAALLGFILVLFFAKVIQARK